MLSDVVHAARRLRRTPAFTAFAVVTLSLAIWIVAGVYSLLRSGMRTDLGLRDASSLVIISKRSPMTGALYPVDLSWLDYQDLRAQSHAFEATAGWASFTNALVTGGTSEIAMGELVSGDYFSTIGLQAERGRLIEPSDDDPAAPPVAVLSASVWRRRLAHDTQVIGSSIRLAGHPFHVIGVVAESYRGLQPHPGFGSPDVWIPLAQAPAVAPSWARQDRGNRNHRWIRMVGRLPRGDSVSKAESQIRIVGDRIDQAEPLPGLPVGGGNYSKPKRDWRASILNEPLDFAQSGDVMRAVLLLPALVLIVACTNLGNLALSRGVSRRNEFALRLAIGASRWQLVRSQLIEYAIVAGLGTVGALVVADRLVTLVASTVGAVFGDVPQYRIDPHLDGVTVLIVFLAALLCLLVAGLVPALQLTRRREAKMVVADQVGGTSPRWRGRSNLIALQMGVSVALLLVAALCVRQLPKLVLSTRAGTSLDRVALVSVPFAIQSASEPTVRKTVDDLLEAARVLPGAVVSAAASDRRFAEIMDVSPEGSTFGSGVAAHTARALSVTPAFFRTVGLSLVAGRGFEDGDTVGSPVVVILNESQARTLFGTANAVGHELQLRAAANSVTRAVVVGIAADIHNTRGTRDDIDDVLYLPFAQRFENNQSIEILTRAIDGADPRPLAVSVRSALRRINPDIAVAFVGRADTVDVGPAVVLRYFTVGFGSLAFLALAFAVSGLYGVLDHVVARRTRELGVRAALGADPERLIRLIVRDGSRPVLEGIILGFGMAAGARLGMQPWFTEPVTAIDPVALVIALIPLIVAAGLACYLPARRAARVDPNVALRHL